VGGREVGWGDNEFTSNKRADYQKTRKILGKMLK